MEDDEEDDEDDELLGLSPDMMLEIGERELIRFEQN